MAIAIHNARIYLQRIGHSGKDLLSDIASCTYITHNEHSTVLIPLLLATELFCHYIQALYYIKILLRRLKHNAGSSSAFLHA